MSHRKNILYSLIFGAIAIFSLHVSDAHAAPLDLHGQAWSSDIGWINFNCADTAAGCTNAYKVQYDDTTGNLSGSAWSSNIGWLSFNRVAPGAAGNPPNSDIGAGSGPIARINLSTGKIDGWARFLSNDGTGVNKWDGWLKLSSTGSDPVFGVTRSGNKITGAAWGSLNVGWVNFCGTGFCVTLDQPLVVSCVGSPAAATTGQTVTWTATVTGAVGAQTFAWSSDGNTGSVNPFNTSYTTAGSKVATVQVTTASGQDSGVINCTGSVAVSAPFDYSLSRSVDITVTRGSSGVSTITRTLNSGTPAPVDLSISGLPVSASASFSNDPANPCPVASMTAVCQSTLTVNVPSTVVAGTYPLTITGNPGGKTVGVILTVKDPPLVVSSCSASPSNPIVGDTVTWSASVSGGNNTYSYSWSAPGGTPSSGSGSTLSTSYSTASPPNKTATVTVVSNGVSSGAVSCTSLVVGSGGAGPGSFYLTHDPLTEPNPTQSASSNCHANNPQCNIASDRYGHFLRDISIGQGGASSPTNIKVNAVGSFSESVTISVDHVERDDDTSSIDCPASITGGCADGKGDGNPVTPYGFVFYFGDFTKPQSDPVAPGNTTQFNAYLTTAKKGRYIIFLKGTTPSGKTATNQVLLVVGSNTPGFKER